MATEIAPDKRDAAMAAVNQVIASISNDEILEGWKLDIRLTRIAAREKLKSADPAENTQGRQEFFAHLLPSVEKAIAEGNTAYLAQEAAREEASLSYMWKIHRQFCIAALQTLGISGEARAAMFEASKTEQTLPNLETPRRWPQRLGSNGAFGGQSGGTMNHRKH